MLCTPHWLQRRLCSIHAKLLGINRPCVRSQTCTQVGGRPAWLDPLHLPSADQLTCRVTGKPLEFLLQVRLTY